MWRTESHAGVVLVRSVLFAQIEGVTHAFSTRCADRDDAFDLGSADQTEEPFFGRRRRLCHAIGLSVEAPSVARQVHGATVLDAERLGPPLPDGDAVVARRDERWAPAVRVADCVPILLGDRRGRALAAVHAGWRGTARSIVRRCVSRLQALGIAPADLIAAVGPAIGACCYRVDRPVLEQVARACEVDPERLEGRGGVSGEPTLALARANRLQLQAAGVPPEHVSCAPMCTRCDPERFFSYRREGQAAGRSMAVAGWLPVGPP